MAKGPPAAQAVGPSGPMTLRAIGVSKAIGEARLLAPVDVSADRGRCVVLRGANGSGKTTLLRLLAGTTSPTLGQVELNGQAVDERTPYTRTHVAALIGPQATYRDLTLADHLVLVDSTWGREPKTAWERADQALDQLEIQHLAARFPHELSSGQQQLFNLTTVLFRPGRVLLLDEPEQRLDTHKRGLLTQILLERKASGVTMVVACHDPQMTDQLADRVLDIAPA